MKELPGFLYQYRPPEGWAPEGWARENLERRVMYFNNPANFNDPTDCPKNPSFSNMPGAIKIMRRNKRLNPSWVSPETTTRNAATKQWHKMRESVGIACLSESPYSPLMWAHYGGGSRGFCLEFDTQDAALFGGDMLHPVNYAQYPPYPDAAVVLEGDFVKAQRLFLTKGEKWKYEQEWRLIRKQEGEVRYNAKALQAIFLGLEADEEMEEFVRRIKQEQYPHVQLFKAFSMGYGVGFRPLDICTIEKP